MKYIYTFLTLLFIVLIGFFVFQKTAHKGPNAQRIACHKNSIVFEKVYNHNLLQKVQNAIHTGAYNLSSSIEEAKYMPTRMFTHVKLEEVDNLVHNALKKYKTLSSTVGDNVDIDYYIYENDKADPGKKTAKSKLYAGYLHFTFAYQGKKVYAIQIDFMDMEGKDISQRVDCAIKFIMTVER
ncbi:MAG: hypothetical protein WBM70_10125 [Sulfurovum sp.]|uniref:hypothetical protein n=1 Tax=Sulfurovum sp. TaxID=1969726 RepID=UPI003C722FF0